MTLLQKMVFCSIYYKCRIFEGFSSLPKEAQIALKSVTQLQRRKFKTLGIVPTPVLEALWQLGFLPNDMAPGRGLRIIELAEYLRKGEYKAENAREKGKWLYHQIMKEEVIGRRAVVRKQRIPAVDIKY